MLIACANASVSAVDSVAHDRFELRGILQLPKQTRFSFHDSETKATYWIDLGQSRGGLHVLEFDPSTKEVLCEYMGERYHLGLNIADDTSLAVLRNENAAQEIEMNPTDVDPAASGAQSLNQIKSKILYSVGARGGPSHTRAQKQVTTGDDASKHDNLELAKVALKQESDIVPDPAAQLNENEKLALEVFEKNYLAVRDAPKDVDVVYQVGPR